MKNGYAIRDIRTGKYLRRMMKWGDLNALETVVLKRSDARLVADNLRKNRYYKVKVVAVELMCKGTGR